MLMNFIRVFDEGESGQDAGENERGTSQAGEEDVPGAFVEDVGEGGEFGGEVSQDALLCLEALLRLLLAPRGDAAGALRRGEVLGVGHEGEEEEGEEESQEEALAQGGRHRRERSGRGTYGRGLTLGERTGCGRTRNGNACKVRKLGHKGRHDQKR